MSIPRDKDRYECLRKDPLFRKMIDSLNITLKSMQCSPEVTFAIENAKIINGNLTDAMSKIREQIKFFKKYRIIRSCNKWILCKYLPSNSIMTNEFDSIATRVLAHVKVETQEANVLSIKLPKNIKNKKKAAISKNSLIAKEQHPVKILLEKNTNIVSDEDELDISKVIRIHNATRIIFAVMNKKANEFLQAVIKYEVKKPIVQLVHERGNSLTIVTKKGMSKPFSLITVRGNELKKNATNFATPKQKYMAGSLLIKSDNKPSIERVFLLSMYSFL